MTPNKSNFTHDIRSFVRREGRITPGQRQALRTLLPRYGLSPADKMDPESIFGRLAPCTLEIGFGNGEALATMAEQRPQEDFIGIEVHRPGVGHLLQLLEKRGLNNVRIYNEDAIPVLRACLPDQCLDRLLLFFPDPWHKKRHHKRRIVQPDFIELVAGRIKPGGLLHMTTDWEDYAVRMLAALQASDKFSNRSGQGNYSPKPDYRPVTKFELRGRRLGHGVWEIVFERKQTA